MWLKIIGGIIVMAASTGIGFVMANRCNERPRQIRQIISCIASLKTYINYVALPLDEALINCTNGTYGAISDLFQKTALILRSNGWMTPNEAIQQAIRDNNKIALAKPELELLTAFGANLGCTGRDDQTNYLDMIQEQLANIEREAIDLRDRNSKMYRYLGICGGLTKFIILV